MTRVVSASIATLLMMAAYAHGQTIDACRKLQDNAARLACYDKLPIPAAAPKAAPKTAAEDPAVAAAKARILKILVDPDSAKFSNVRIRTAPDGSRAVCGDVNAKNSLGGFAGNRMFVVDSSMVPRVLVERSGPQNPTTFDNLVLGASLGENLKVHSKYCQGG
jgi:hypothetical protein